MLIQSTLIIAREVGIIIALSQTQSCATELHRETKKEGEREKERKRAKRTEALTHHWRA